LHDGNGQTGDARLLAELFERALEKAEGKVLLCGCRHVQGHNHRQRDESRPEDVHDTFRNLDRMITLETRSLRGHDV
jgi:hypothetical protein